MTRFLVFTVLLCTASLAHAQGMPLSTSSDDARAHFDQGRARMAAADFAGARTHLDAALAADPSFGMAHMYRAVVSPPAERAEHMRLASAARVSDGERHMIDSYVAHLDGDHDREIELLGAAVEQFPDDPYARFARGFTLYFQDRHADALEDFREVLADDPDFAGAYNGMGYAAMEMGDMAAAEAAFRGYIRAAPDEANPYDSMGEFLMEAGRMDEAERHFEQALVRNPDFSNSTLNLARIGLERSDLRFERAIAAGDADAIAALYTDDAMVMAPDMPPIQGRDAIRDHFAAILASGVDGLDIQTAEVRRFDDTAVRRSDIVLRAGGQVVDRAKALEVHRLVDGEWLYVRDMYSSNGPETSSAR